MSIESVMPSSHLILCCPLLLLPPSLPALESFPMSQLFSWGSQSTGVSALASFLPKNTQDWSPLEWTGWISLSPKDSQESSPTPQFKSINSSALSFLIQNPKRRCYQSVALNMSANLEDPAMATGLEKVNPYSNPKKGSTKECSNHWTITLISHAGKVMLKILHARL